MITKKFILPGLALGAMLMGSIPAHAQIPSIDLGTLPSSGIKSIRINGSATNVFKFDHTGGELNLGTVNVSFGKKLGIKLYSDTDHNGVFNPGSGLDHDTLLVTSTFGAINGDRGIFTIQKSQGTYFALVSPQDQNSLTASYSFIASSTGNQQSNLIAARDVVASGVVSSTFLSFPLNNKQTSNFYKFSLSSGQQTNITMTPHNILAKMRVLQDANSDHAIVLDDEIVSSTAPSGSQQTLTVKRPGDYYLQVSQPFPVLSDSPSFTTDVKFQFSALN